MIRHIIQKEILEHFKSPRFVMVYGVACVLLLLAFYTGAQNYHSQRESYEAALSNHAMALAEHTNWINVEHELYLPPDPMSVLVSGVSNDIGRTIPLTSSELQTKGSRFSEHPLFAVFRAMDLEFLFTTVFTLIAIVFAFDAINGERERGTLALIFAQSMSRASFIFGKIIGILLALLVPLLVPIVLGLIVLLSFGVPFSFEDWVRLLLILTIGFLLLSFMLTLTVGVSALVRTPSTSFLVMLMVWVVFVMIIPKASVLLAGRAIEVPNIDEIARQKNSYRIQLFNDDLSKIESFEASPGKEIPEVIQEWQTYMGDLRSKRLEKTSSFNQKLNESFQNQTRLRREVSITIASTSPIAATSLLMSHLANTSLYLEESYINQAKEYAHVYDAFIEEKTGHVNKSGFRIQMISDEKEPTIDLSELPQFEWKQQPLKEALASSINAFSSLIVWNLVALICAWFIFYRTEIK